MLGDEFWAPCCMINAALCTINLFNQYFYSSIVYWLIQHESAVVCFDKSHVSESVC